MEPNKLNPERSCWLKWPPTTPQQNCAFIVRGRKRNGCAEMKADFQNSSRTIVPVDGDNLLLLRETGRKAVLFRLGMDIGV